MTLSALKEWYFRDYESEKADIDESVVARFARGNVRVQEGHYINQRQLEELSARAKSALERMMSAAE